MTLFLHLLVAMEKESKQSFIDCSSKKLEETRFQLVYCPTNADNTNNRTPVNFIDSPFLILDNDTDFLCHLLHHVHFVNAVTAFS